MRKLKLQVQMSVDGFVASPKGELDWMVWNWDDALKNYVAAITDPVDCILLGRVLAQGFIPHWAAAAAADNPEGFATKMHESPKIVFSNTLTTHDWPNTNLASGLVDTIAELKKEAGGDIIAYGGSRFVTSLIKHGLIDEYHLFVNPTALGAGMPIFQGLDNRQNFKLVGSQSFECGIVVLCYQRA